jgi:nitrous oxidase accessory protein NosD
VFENLKVKNYGAAANTLHGVFYVTGVLGAITNSVIRDIYASGLANFGLCIRDCQDTKIENVRLYGASTYACAAFEGDGISLPKFGASEHVRVRDCHVEDSGGMAGRYSRNGPPRNGDRTRRNTTITKTDLTYKR